MSRFQHSKNDDNLGFPLRESGREIRTVLEDGCVEYEWRPDAVPPLAARDMDGDAGTTSDDVLTDVSGDLADASGLADLVEAVQDTLAALPEMMAEAMKKAQDEADGDFETYLSPGQFE